MKILLTSWLGGIEKVNGVRVPAPLANRNGLLDTLKSIWIQNAKVFIVCGEPDNHAKNDAICACLKEAFPMSGLSISGIVSCDDRNPNAAEQLSDTDVLVLAGGHVPSQNAFMKKIHLKEQLETFRGIIVTWSAGAINCAGIVYAGPDLDGEAIDPAYERWIHGLGLTELNLFPHYQSLKEAMLDGLRLMEDITYPDSFVHELIALNDGSYILLDDGKATLFGEAYKIRDGKLWQICRDEESIPL